MEYRKECFSSSRGNTANFITGRFIMPSTVRTVATQTTSSVLGCTWSIRSIFQCVGGWLGAFTNTRSPIFTFGCCLVHLNRLCRVDKYSTDHRFQNDWLHYFISSHRVNKFWRVEVQSGDRIKTSGSPIKKCDGVNGSRSLGSADCAVNGRELRITSIWVASVAMLIHRTWKFNFLWLDANG